MSFNEGFLYRNPSFIYPYSVARPQNNIEKVIRNCIPVKSSLLIAVSGGKDSVALLHACFQLMDKFRLRIAVAHIDHGLRKNSKKDAQFVAELCRKYGLECFTVRLEKPSKSENTEAWGRKERYKFLKETAQRNKYDLILTAHTANDVAETFLIRLISNKELNSIEYMDSERKVLRPFLQVSTQEVYRYIKENKLKYAEDETNKEDRFLRNKIRNQLLPFLSKKFDKRITETLSQRAREIQEDSKGLFSMYERPLMIINTYEFGSKDWLRTVRQEIEKLPELLAWRLVESVFKPVLGFNAGRDKSRELLKFFKGDIQGVQLPGGKNVRFRASGIVIL